MIRLALLFLVACGVPDPVALEEWVREYPGSLPGNAWKEAAAILVRDGATGEPLRGVLVRQYDEHVPTHDGRWAPLAMELRTDEYGIAWKPMPEEQMGGHWVAQADGYAPASVFGSWNHTFDLKRGRTRRSRIVGLDGKPVAGVRVRYQMGCPHSPVVRTADTDARGIATFVGVDDGMFSYRHPGLAGSLASPKYEAYLPPYVTYARPGGPVTGRILLADGRPAAGGVAVGAVAYGSLAPIAEDGSFRLQSVAVGAELSVYFDSEWHEFGEGWYRRGGPLVHRIGAAAQPALHAVTVDVVGCSPDEERPVGFERLSDGARWWRGIHGVPVSLPPGRYRAILGDRFSDLVGESDAFTVPGTQTATITPRRQARLQVEWAQPELSEGWARVYLGRREHQWEIDSPGAPCLPPATAAVLSVERDGVRGHFEIPAAENGVRRVVVRLPDRKILAVPRPGEAQVWLHAAIEPDDTQLDRAAGTLVTRQTGEVAVTVTDESEVRVLYYDLPFKAPAEPIAATRVERHTVPAPRELRVQYANGAPVAEAKVRVWEESLDPVWRDNVGWPQEKTGPRGRVRMPWFRDGATVFIGIEDDDVMGRTVVLRGDGPYVVTLGDCALTVVLSREEFESPTLYLDGEIWWFHDGVISLRGLDPGPHTLIVGAKGRRHYVHRIVLKPREHREISVKLPPRE